MHNPSDNLDAHALLAEQGWMRSLALALLKDAHLADDAVQEAVLAALRRSPADDRPLRPWLGTVLRNAARKRAERERNRAATEVGRAREQGEAAGPSSDELAARLELQGLVVEVVRELDEPYRSTLLLRFFEDLTPTQIAQRQGLPAGTVRWRLKVGLDSVRERLDARHDGDRLAWAGALVPYLRPDERLASGALASLLTEILAMPPIAHASLFLISTLAVGAAVLRPDEPPPAPPAATLAAAPAAGAAPAAPTATADVDQDPDLADRQSVLATPDDGAPAMPALDDLLAWAAAEMRAGWRAQRDEEIEPERLAGMLADFETLVRTVPRLTAARLAKDLTRAEARAVGGSLFEILGRVEDGDAGPQLGLAADAEAFAAYFELIERGPEVDALAALADPEFELLPGTTLSFPPGVFRVVDLFDRLAPVPGGVTLRGAGMDRTLLVAERGFRTDLALANFGLADLTVHSENDYLFRLSEPASIVLDRVRVVGYDSGGGGSYAFYAAELALLARDSVFEGGYGRGPAGGNLLHGDALIARFERCRFDQTAIGFAMLRNDEDAAVFVDCDLTRLMDWGGEDSVESTIRANVGIALRDSPRGYFERVDPTDGSPVRPPKKDLDALFPDWESRSRR